VADDAAPLDGRRCWGIVACGVMEG